MSEALDAALTARRKVRRPSSCNPDTEFRMGWKAAATPRTVATLEEIAALPRLTVVRTGDRFWQKLGGVMPYHEWQSPDGGFAVNNAHFADYLEFRDPAEIVFIPGDTQ
jgi:hypothetical protein